jgi:hypothetical protein
MRSMAGVKYEYVDQHILLRFEPGLVMAPMDPLLLQTPEEAFSHRVIPAITFSRANYRTVFQGDSVRMFDPVGTPEKSGFKHCCTDSCDLFQDHVKFESPEGTLFVLGNTVAWKMHNIITSSGKTRTAKSLETYHFEPDESLQIRTRCDVSDARSGEIGASMRKYLLGSSPKMINPAITIPASSPRLAVNRGCRAPRCCRCLR